METRPSLHGKSDVMHNFSLQVAGEWPWHPCREPWICLPTKGLCNMQHMEIEKTTLIGKGTISFGNIVVPLNGILFILSSLLSHGGCQKPGPPSKSGSFPKICLAWADSLCEGLQGDVLLQRFLYDWKGCCEIGKECFQLRKVLVSCLSSPEQKTFWLSLWSWCLQTTRHLVQTSAVKMCTKGAFYSADGGYLCLRKAANSGSGQQLAVLANDIYFKISVLGIWHPHHEFSHPFFEDQCNYERFALQTFEDEKESSDQLLALRGIWSGLVRLYHDGNSLSLKNPWEVRKVVQIAVVANRKHQWGGLIPPYPRFYVHSLTRNTLLNLEATLVIEKMPRRIPDRTTLHGKIFCFYSCKVPVWKVSYSFKLSPN